MAYSELAATILLLISSHCCFAADTNSFSYSLSYNRNASQSFTTTWTSNLNSVFNNLTANLDRGSNGYSIAAAGEEGPDRVFALIQCRGDISPADCMECTQESFRLAAKYCDGSKSCVVWQKWCLLRYANDSFFGTWDGSGGSMPSSNETSLVDPEAAIEGKNMMSELVAGAPNERLMFARSATGDRKRFGLAQCTRDLAKKDCGHCLDHLCKNFGPIVKDTIPWGIYGVGCFMMYEHYEFYFNSSTTRPTVTEEKSSDTGENISNGWIVMCTAILTAVLILNS